MSPAALPWKNDVFLNFRSADTGKNFTSHLYAALSQKGVVTFKGDQELEGTRRSAISAIQDSTISVVIFSKNYASSTRCLDELVEIFQCMKSKGQIVLPVFYSVDPAEVRKQTGIFGDSFAKHEQIFHNDIAKVQQWRVAATGMANLSGWDIQDRHESELIEEIVEEVLKKLRKSNHRFSGASKDFVGMSSRLNEMMSSYLGKGDSNDVGFMGVCGMGGIGKTTIARAVYAELTCEFEGSCFLANVREEEQKNGLTSLQKQLISEILMDKSNMVWDVHSGMNQIKNRLSHKKVLIVLDDVNHLEQLQALAGMRNWFGNGSRIIITSRDEDLLTTHGVEEIYRVQGFDYDEALHLFCLKAFKSDCPPAEDEYVEMSNRFVNYANGLPLALDVLGSFLFGRSVNEWRSALDRLKEIPNKEILDKLYISFDGLLEMEKKIFLDIACFFKGRDKDYVIQVLKSCGFSAEIGMRVLINKSLITISNDRIWMHDLLQVMGREIVRRSSCEEPGKRSRLWLYEDVYHVLSSNTGTEQIEGIVLDSCEQEQEFLSAKAFTNMRSLRLLRLQNLHLSDSLEFLSNKLRYLDWEGYPFKSLPSTFQPDKIVELHLQSSNITQLWKGIKPLKMLKVIDLSYSVNLIKTMDFTDVPNLEKLKLEGCTRLSEVHQSIGVLKRLVLLNLKDCKGLVRIPSNICDLKSLKTLILHGCSKLENLPEGLWDMKCLEKLHIGGIPAKQQPASAKSWKFLLPSWLLPTKTLNLMDFLPSLSVVRSLKSLDLSYCNLVEGALPNDLNWCFPSLQTLNLSGNHFITIPTSIIRLSRLEDLRFANCKKLQTLPNLPPSILFLNTDGCSSLETLLPKTIARHYRQENLCFANCERLQSLPDLTSSIVNLSVEGLTAEANFQGALTFVNRIGLVEIHGNNCSAFTRLTSYLHFLLKHSSQGLFNPSSHVSMCLAGSEVPEWFNYQEIGSSLELQLPPHWLTDRWMGFAICVVFEARDDEVPVPMSKPSNIFCDFHARTTPDQLVFLGRPSMQISGDMNVVSEQLWFNFMPRSSLNCVENLWESCAKLKASFYSDGLKVKYSGLRIIYDHDVGELVQCHRHFEVLDLLINNNDSDKRKRSNNGDQSCDSGSGRAKYPENGNCGGALSSKKMKMTMDSQLQH